MQNLLPACRVLQSFCTKASGWAGRSAPVTRVQVLVGCKNRPFPTLWRWETSAANTYPILCGVCHCAALYSEGPPPPSLKIWQNDIQCILTLTTRKARVSLVVLLVLLDGKRRSKETVSSWRPLTWSASVWPACFCVDAGASVWFWTCADELYDANSPVNRKLLMFWSWECVTLWLLPHHTWRMQQRTHTQRNETLQRRLCVYFLPFPVKKLLLIILFLQLSIKYTSVPIIVLLLIKGCSSFIFLCLLTTISHWPLVFKGLYIPEWRVNLEKQCAILKYCVTTEFFFNLI